MGNLLQRERIMTMRNLVEGRKSQNTKKWKWKRKTIPATTDNKASMPKNINNYNYILYTERI